MEQVPREVVGFPSLEMFGAWQDPALNCLCAAAQKTGCAHL